MFSYIEKFNYLHNSEILYFSPSVKELQNSGKISHLQMKADFKVSSRKISLQEKPSRQSFFFLMK